MHSYLLTVLIMYNNIPALQVKVHVREGKKEWIENWNMSCCLLLADHPITIVELNAGWMQYKQPTIYLVIS